MAITLRGSVENSAIDGADFTLDLTTISGLAEGDAVYAFGGATNVTGPLALSFNGGGGTNLDAVARVVTHRKVQTSSVDTSVAVDTGAAAGSGDASAAVAFALIGVDRTVPEDATTTTAVGSSTNPNPPAITTVTAGAWVLVFASSLVSDASVTAPTNYVNQIDRNAADTASVTVGGATREIATPAAEDPGTWTTWSTGGWRAVTVAVRPARGPLTRGGHKVFGGYKLKGRLLWHATLPLILPGTFMRLGVVIQPYHTEWQRDAARLLRNIQPLPQLRKAA